MHGDHRGTPIQRLVFVTGHGAAVLAVIWLFWGNGPASPWFHAGVVERQIALFVCSSVYWIRSTATVVLLLRRSVEWSEALVVLPWLWVIHLGFAFAGGSKPIPLDAFDYVALALYALGSYLNSASEYQRMRWKRKPENVGRLYREGLFRHSMHINYFGDSVLFTGFALLARSLWALLIPTVMTAGFVFQHIPALDRYLSERYGQQFERYARHTKRFVPYLY